MKQNPSLTTAKKSKWYQDHSVYKVKDSTVGFNFAVIGDELLMELAILMYSYQNKYISPKCSNYYISLPLLTRIFIAQQSS